MKSRSPDSDSVVLMLDREECDRARLRRDRRYDGRFFTGVRTTKIYCRPVCPVRPAQSRNVAFYPTAAAAQAAGFRPCLRCRPEAAPFSPAWKGSRATVHRAVRLIHAGALDRDSVDALAERLGIGVRHLDRLFVKHIGASPSQFAQANRLHKAKRLLDDTSLPMTEVAARAGFSSLRRFNATFAEIYKRSPTEIRRVHFRAAALTRPCALGVPRKERARLAPGPSHKRRSLLT
ncbi:MAG: transcriptional regulator [Alphaproteobacteria bacterium RIFCSPHIGHO2_12_FULL_66_14]|jgi:AraC family transcriptional regulator of adaptative response / DNA-3-methyladenine glycosylase II|nr:MAG: transcriptional regulator [Alphaproteobacteria bacterium RIFCSPHIGHO2_12_FULL_66_14]